LRSNQISDIRNLAGLTNLTYLHLDRNRINDISPIVDLTGLTFLCLESNQISDLTPLSNLTKLTELYLTANQIDDITPLSNLARLTLLLLGNNQINDLAPLADLVELETLDLQSNDVTNLAPLSGLVRLHTLDLQNNFISDFSHVSHVAVVNSENQNRPPVPDPILSTATDISHIPYIGNRDLFHLPAEHARAYAEAIRSAEAEPDCWTNDVCVCNFETLYPVLIDIYGDGVPLLLIAQRACRFLSPNRWFGFEVIYNLFAFQDGTFIRIDRNMNIATAFFQNENVLWLYSGYYGDWTGIYRVRNGTVEQIITFGATWFADEDSTYRIDGIEVSADEYVELLERLNLLGVIRGDILTDIIGRHQTWSYGMVGSRGPFMLEYFTREQAARIFEKYAESLG
jgi:internalin A